MTDSEGDVSFLAEIVIGGTTFKSTVFPVGRTYGDMKDWALSEAGKEHRKSSLVKFQRYQAKFGQYVDSSAELSDRPKDGWKIRIILEVMLETLIDEALNDNDDGRWTMHDDDDFMNQAREDIANIISSPVVAAHQSELGLLTISQPRSAPKALLDAGFSPTRNELSRKYAQFFFRDDEALDIDHILRLKLTDAEIDDILVNFTAIKYATANDLDVLRVRRKLIRICQEWLMANCGMKNKPSVLEKARAAYSIWRRFPFFSLPPSDSAILPYQLIYCPRYYRGFLGMACANKRQNSFGSTSATAKNAKKTVPAPAGEQSPHPIADSSDEMKLLKLTLQTQNLRSAPDSVVNEARRNMMKLQLFRRSEIKREELTATSIIEQYPMLITLPEILVKDFEYEIKEADVSRTDRKAQWEKAAGFIVRHGFAMQTHTNGIGQVFKAFNTVSMPDIESLSIDEVGYLALCLLPHILQPRIVQGKEGKRDRFSATTALGQLIQFAKAGSSMFAALETLKKEKGVTHPCLLAFTQTGVMGGKLSDLFVIVYAVPIFFPDATVSVSVETLFASFFAFNLSYPPSLYGVYSLLEMLYNVPPTIKSNSAVADLYSRINSAV